MIIYHSFSYTFGRHLQQVYHPFQTSIHNISSIRSSSQSCSVFRHYNSPNSNIDYLQVWLLIFYCGHCGNNGSTYCRNVQNFHSHQFDSITKAALAPPISLVTMDVISASLPLCWIVGLFKHHSCQVFILIQKMFSLL